MRSGGRRAVAALLLLGTAVLAGCGEQDSSSPGEMAGSDPAASETPYETPTESPTYETPEMPELDSSELEANLARLSPEDRALADHHLGNRLGEGTWLVASPMTVEEAKAILLGPDPQLARERDVIGGDASAYAFLQVGDGVVAHEDTGFGDPPRQLLAALSRDGGTAAVATDNIEAMVRFGYARDGEVVFDEFEYAFVDDLEEVPAEVRDLARLAWDDLEGPMVKTADWLGVATAMSEKVTGVRPTRDVRKVDDWYVVPLPWA